MLETIIFIFFISLLVVIGLVLSIPFILLFNYLMIKDSIKRFDDIKTVTLNNFYVDFITATGENLTTEVGYCIDKGVALCGVERLKRIKMDNKCYPMSSLSSYEIIKTNETIDALFTKSNIKNGEHYYLYSKNQIECRNKEIIKNKKIATELKNDKRKFWEEFVRTLKWK
jgi:hypothetical protein